MRSTVSTLLMAWGIAYKKEQKQLSQMVAKMGWNNTASMLKKIRAEHNCTLVQAIARYNVT